MLGNRRVNRQKPAVPPSEAERQEVTENERQGQFEGISPTCLEVKEKVESLPFCKRKTPEECSRARISYFPAGISPGERRATLN